ncbi:MAG: hypothetical protein IT212_07465 [Bacteroidia bacterium]|nr:hypothetical protein [Bacteroidia bacterium]
MAEKKSIVKQSSTIKKLLKERFEKLELSYTKVAAEAKRFGQSNVKVETLSRYFNDVSINSLTEESIIFLCYRYGIQIALMVGKPKVVGGKIKLEIPDYDEKDCLEKTKKIFGNVKR